MSKIIPRISTRGYYDLTFGKTLKKNSYFLYPKKDFENFIGKKELTIMIHGLRNDNAGAIAKTIIAKTKFKKLGYSFPVIGYSYDSNTKGAHLRKFAKRAINTGQIIAKKNGRNLSLFIQDFKEMSPQTKIRLVGHSLGSNVILSTVDNLSKKIDNKNIIEAVYFFGASIPSDTLCLKKHGKLFNMIVSKKIMNYYSPSDEVLSWGSKEKLVDPPLGLNGAIGNSIPKYHQKLVKPKNHRFASYAAVLNRFP